MSATLERTFSIARDLARRADRKMRRLYAVRIDKIGLDAFAATRAELAAEVQRQLTMLWKEYALADDSELTASAQQVKRNLLASFEAWH